VAEASVRKTRRSAGADEVTFTQAFASGFRIIFRERRVPWIAAQIPSLVVQGFFHLIPFLRTRICNKGALQFEYRPATADWQVLHEVVDRDEYAINQKNLSPDSVVIDIGAHLGSFAVLAATNAPEGMVFSYEPDPANFRLLTRNVARNKLANVRTFMCAVASTPGPKTLFRGMSNWSHSLSDRRYSRRHIVDGVTLPQILEEHDVKTCHVLKIDCEGSEYEILMGLPPKVLGQIECIIGEWHPTPAGPTELGFKHLGEFLEAHGFRVDPDPRSSREIPQGTFRAIRQHSKS
jgi:FkbM family methyltransferase